MLVRGTLLRLQVAGCQKRIKLATFTTIKQNNTKSRKAKKYKIYAKNTKK